LGLLASAVGAGQWGLPGLPAQECCLVVRQGMWLPVRPPHSIAGAASFSTWWLPLAMEAAVQEGRRPTGNSEA